MRLAQSTSRSWMEVTVVEEEMIGVLIYRSELPYFSLLD